MEEPVITDKQIQDAFLNTNFGNRNHRRLLEVSVLKKLVDYHCGHTITCIMEKIQLIGKTGKVTMKGKKFIRQAYHQEMLNSG